jgi:drug/metabolite transporter (DMT)-like permease
MPSGGAWAAALALGALCTGAAYALYFRLIAAVGAAKAMTVAFLIPVFGMLWGVVFLSEDVTLRMLIGVAVVLVGTALSVELKLATDAIAWASTALSRRSGGRGDAPDGA